MNRREYRKINRKRPRRDWPVEICAWLIIFALGAMTFFAVRWVFF